MNDDQLILYYYRDGLSADERLLISNAIASDESIAARYQALSEELAAFDREPVPTLSADRRQRFHEGLDAAIRVEQGRMKARKSLSHKWSFFLGAGVTAAVLLLAGNLLPLGTTPDTSPIEMPTVAEATADGSNVAFERSIKVHFRESQDYLDGLQLDVSDPSVSNRNLLILQMIEQNRFYEKVAKQNDAPELARVLRAFEPVLLELAQEDISTEQAEALRAKLTFQLNVMLTKLARTASNDAITT